MLRRYFPSEAVASMIKLPKPLRDNLHFLCVEVDSQVASLQSYFETPAAAVARRIVDRAGYAYNLKVRIHSATVQKLRSSKRQAQRDLMLRSIEFIATDLERLAEISRNCVRQLEYIEAFELLGAKRYIGMLKRVRKAIAQIEPALQADDSTLAIQMGKSLGRMASDYEKLLKRYRLALREVPAHTDDLTRALFVAYEVRQMGEALVHISESIISANLGQPVNFERFFSLRSLVSDLEADEEDLQISAIAQTRSGSSISGISAGDESENGYLAIFKDGEKRKVKEERAGVRSWHEIYPGLAPKILSYEKRGQSAALLIEHLPGHTFEQIVLNESDELVDEAFKRLAKTLKSIWKATRSQEPAQASFMQQLQKRMNEVYRIHPEFARTDSKICGLPVPSFDTLVAAVTKREKHWPAPFSVYIHGDFNVDNIIYDPMERRINFIDLHRSRYMDYVQDLSVFMVSNYRLQVLDSDTRARINDLALRLYDVARREAKKQNDELFEVRLALGLVRSFASSTRFILDKSLARRMFMRARYLLEQVLAIQPGKETKYRIPMKEIFVD
ncbi:phosphotransferase family enzyme [Marinobacterium mangrovicola]|uniref:Phosphotransferase family enzyme n=2 Tax=Marinobacterium mangrovicola TaxID=1476959 RepID=A0A4R1GLA6_9GAMM|nr:phosphotransferase family enzyme [Marinobacterium mangrovicola]